MANRDYGGYGRGESSRGRESSIFSDDDDRWGRGSGRWSSEHGRGHGGRDDDRGFFERAGDEVRSWFGDEEAERRREMDLRRDEARGAFGGEDYDRRYGSRTRYGAGGFGAYETGRERGWGDDYGSRRGGARSETLGQGGGQGRGESGRSEYGGRGDFMGRSQWDDNYRRWRDQQIEQFDCEYADYCRERQQQFDRDFDSWRSSRLTQGGVGGGDTISGATRPFGSESAAATSAGGGGTSSAMSSGSGSTRTATAETGDTGSGGRGRSRG